MKVDTRRLRFELSTAADGVALILRRLPGMNRRTRPIMRIAAGATAIALLAPLSGCLSSVPPVEAAEPGESQRPTAPTPTWTSVEVGEHPDLTFERGASLEPGMVTQWSDGLRDEQGWRMSSPDDGQGNWSYATRDGTCVARFWQGHVEDMAATDDLKASDFVLASVIEADPEELEGKVSTGAFSHRLSGLGSVDNRYLHGTFDDGVSWNIAARGFAATRSAVIVDVKCAPGGDATKTAGVVWRENAVRADRARNQ